MWHVIVFKSEVNEEKWSQNFFLDKHHFVVLQRSSSQMTTHASKSKRQEDKTSKSFFGELLWLWKKGTSLLLFTLFRRRKCHLAFLHGGTTMKWWRHEEGIYWPLNQLPIITCKSYFYPFYACPLVGISAATNERNERMYNIWRFELPVRFLTCSNRISVKIMQGCSCYDLAMGHPQKIYGLES